MKYQTFFGQGMSICTECKKGFYPSSEDTAWAIGRCVKCIEGARQQMLSLLKNSAIIDGKPVE